MAQSESSALETTNLLQRNDGVHRNRLDQPRFCRASNPVIGILAALAISAIFCINHRASKTADPSTPFPADFLWGAATSSYQIEGGTTAGGRGQSIWDVWCVQSMENCNGDTGDVTDDHYHRWKEDVDLMKSLGLKAYRFSISWSRILPNGTAHYGDEDAADAVKENGTFIDGINQEGLQFYDNIVDYLIESGIEPFITLYHWDLPQALQDRYGGWADRSIIEDFGDYARICFHHFGDRVRYWITINEGWTTAIHGYEEGSNAPGFMGEDVGGTGRPYLVGHHLLLAHARAVQVFRDEGYVSSCQRVGSDKLSKIGISNSGDHRFPLDPTSDEDWEAATRALEFQLGWMTDPIWLGKFSLLSSLSPRPSSLLINEFDD